MTEGDPSWAGPLAGLALKLPVFHVLEPEVREQFAPDVAQKQLAMSELVLDGETLGAAVRAVRESAT